MNTTTITRYMPHTFAKLYPTPSTLSAGVLLAIISNVLFGVLYVYGKWLAPLGGTDIFLWRMVMMWGCLMVFIAISGRYRMMLADIRAIRGLGAWLMMLVPTLIFASQLWLFVWAPLNGRGVQVSMGYFLFPLVMVLVGALLGERLARLQWLAVALAATGVALAMMQAGQVGVATFWVCLTYPIYYVLRRRLGVRALTGLTLDVTLIAPVCLAVLLWSGGAWGVVVADGMMLIKVIGLGAISVLALQSNLEANRLLPTSLFGMLGYLEPALLFILTITVLGAPVSAGMLVSFGLIWAGIGCLVAWGLLKR